MNNRLRELRKEKGLTQMELAKQLNVSDRSVGFYETGERDPDTDTLRKLSDFFDVSIDYLLCRSDIRKTGKVETKAYHNLDIAGLPDEAIKQVEDYIEFVKQKYNPDGSLKK
ncbi:helix-turn-helix transcriptional regulator [Clostridium sp. BNL1100]|uniref:helix-turn-helix domain-containing protein n=1 Tax=Clostridium sp. BNL1100 TaxID=755731 RepID=UPI00024A77AE|nr:helix-turn-helix transcriptional regulator [Clostridium sp. BNL1100]AEY64809.1 putative transcriptional regulator [Clostridium sp. BNL1100]